MRHIFVTKSVIKSELWAEMTSDHINWSTLKAISAFITKNIFNVVFFLMEGGPKICPTLDDFII